MEELGRRTFELPLLSLRFRIVIVWMIINMLPQALFALWNLVAAVGTNFEDIRKVLFTYPQFILCPSFSVYTFGSIDTNDWCSR